MELTTSLQFVRGIGPARAEMLRSRGLETVLDLLYHLPFRYEDRRQIKDLRSLTPGEKVTVLARVERGSISRFRKNATGLFEATLSDGRGTLHARWFNNKRLAEILVPGVHVALFGKVESERRNSLLMVQPEFEILDEAEGEESLHTGRITPIYEAVVKISTRIFRSLLHRVLSEVELPSDPLPDPIRRRLALPSLADALREVHQPGQNADVRLLNEFRSPGQFRLIFDEFFWLECGLALKRTKARKADGISFSVTAKARDQIKRMLPFKPTRAQRRVIQEIVDDMKAPYPMNRLLQGDVGSGKTIVAAQAAVIAIENGFQVAFLAPTEILAAQHYAYFRRLLEPLGYVVTLLTGSLSPRDKQRLKNAAATGFSHVVLGTHALLQKDVAFQKLGLAIVDEQHRFGVVQRLMLFDKGTRPDVLVMTATPIPRTLALTVYGDLEISSIDELPPGRKPVTTRHIAEPAIDRVWQFVAKQIEEGRQAYVVYPVVEESETNAMKAAEKGFEHLSKKIFPVVPVGLLHGKMTSDEKERAMALFQQGKTKILVSTTVIEVGVDVPNATVMVIEQAERFGLAQIHQLRGRVGRGSGQSYCFLVTGPLNDISGERIRTVVESNDGFYIAEMDMRLRGPGEFFGTRQSGIPGLRIANLFRDADILELARSEARALIGNPEAGDELRGVVRHIQDHWQRQYGYVQVG
ncbi:MAG TPA: ATP-dependent DNA helicase RecG [Bryobacteraceae bacterium]